MAPENAVQCSEAKNETFSAGENVLVDVSDIFYFFCLGEGKGKPVAPGRGGGRFSIEIPRGGGGFSHKRGKNQTFFPLEKMFCFRKSGTCRFVTHPLAKKCRNIVGTELRTKRTLAYREHCHCSARTIKGQ